MAVKVDATPFAALDLVNGHCLRAIAAPTRFGAGGWDGTAGQQAPSMPAEQRHDSPTPASQARLPVQLQGATACMVVGAGLTAVKVR